MAQSDGDAAADPTRSPPRRTRAFLTTGPGRLTVAMPALVAVVLLAAWLVVDTRGGQAEDAGRAAPGPPSAVAEPSTFPPAASDLPLPVAADGGQVRVVESGFTPIPERTNHRVSWALLVENTSRRSAVALTVLVDIVDADGDSLLEAGPDAHVVTVMPGQRVGVGRLSYVTEPTAAELVTTLEETSWWPPDNDVRPIAAVRVSEIELSRDGDRWAPGDPLTVRFRVDSDHHVMWENVTSYLILRDRDGEVIGGLQELLWTRIPPGWSIRAVRVNDPLPEQVDIRQTEIYLFD